MDSNDQKVTKMVDEQRGSDEEAKQAAPFEELCGDCGCADGQHSRQCSYDIANII